MANPCWLYAVVTSPRSGVYGTGWRHNDQVIIEGIAYNKRTEPIWYFISVSGWRIPNGYEMGTPRMDVISVRTFRD